MIMTVGKRPLRFALAAMMVVGLGVAPPYCGRYDEMYDFYVQAYARTTRRGTRRIASTREARGTSGMTSVFGLRR